MIDKSKGWGQTPEIIEIMRLMLLAFLVEDTGIVWEIKADWQFWDLVFNCRYGIYKWSILQTQSLSPKKQTDEYNFRDDIRVLADEIVAAYRRRMQTSCNECKTCLMPTSDPGIYKCEYCIEQARKK